MQMRQAAALRVAWRNRPCIHPSTEREYDLGSHTGDRRPENDARAERQGSQSFDASTEGGYGPSEGIPD